MLNLPNLTVCKVIQKVIPVELVTNHLPFTSYDMKSATTVIISYISNSLPEVAQ